MAKKQMTTGASPSVSSTQGQSSKKPAASKRKPAPGKGATSKRYTEAEKDAFCAKALELGLQPAMQVMGYPDSKTTAWYWLEQRGLEIEKDTLRQRAAQLQQLYSQREKLVLLHETLRAIHHRLQADPNTGLFYEELDGKELTALANAANKTIQTMELLEGRVTERSEHVSVDSMDFELRQLIDDVRRENAVREAALTNGDHDNAGGESDGDAGDVATEAAQDAGAAAAGEGAHRA